MNTHDVITMVHALILDHVPAKARATPSGWTTMNCPMCSDRRSRGGVLVTGPDIAYHCFNCGYAVKWSPDSMSLSRKFQNLALSMGASPQSLQQAQFQLLKMGAADVGDWHSTGISTPVGRFPTVEPPGPWQMVHDLDPQHAVRQYAVSRGVLGKYPLWRVDHLGMRNRLTIPMYYQHRLVGWTARHINPQKHMAKYIHEKPPGGYVFNLDPVLDQQRKIVVLVEGVLDAVAIGGQAVLSNHATPEQVELINGLGCEVIVCADRDTAGEALVEQALEQSWKVAIPPWETHIKDAHDAAMAYGAMATLHSIIHHATSSTAKIRVHRRLNVKHN